MKKFSAFQIILLAVFGSLAVAGVLIFAIATSSSGSKSLGPVSIWGTLDGGTMTTLLQDLGQNDRDFSQVSYKQQDASTFQSNLTQALASGSGPDLFLISEDYAYTDSGEIAAIPYATISRTQFQNTFVSAANPYLGQTGTLALPILVDPLVLYWNKDLLASAGISEPPQYWDQLFTMAQTLSQKDASGDITRSAIAFGTYDNIDDAKDILALLMLQAGVPITEDDSSGALQSAVGSDLAGGNVAQNAASALLFYTGFADPSKQYYSWNGSLPEAQQAFAQGDVALYVGYASEEAAIQKQNPDLDFGISAVPQIRGQATTLDVARVYGLAIARAGKNQTAAFTIASLLASSQNASAVSQAFGLPSARRDALSSPEQDQAELFRQSAIMAQSWTDPDPVQTASIFRGMIEDTTSGALSITDAISRADQQMNAILHPQKQ